MTAEGAKSGEDVAQLMQRIGEQAREAAARLATATTADKNTALRQGAASLRARQDDILRENALDLAAGRRKNLSAAMIDRLALDAGRIEAMASGLEEIADLPDPVGAVMAEWDRPSGLRISRVRTPLGVIGVIYESRPNVTADAGGLCLKAGNAAILRCGSESFHSSSAIMESLSAGLAAARLPAAGIQLVPTTDRAAVGAMLTMSDCIDVIVPRGGKSLIERITAESRVPLFKHLEGICHTYVHTAADPEMARAVVLNAKMRRTGICGATETLLIDRAVAGTLLRPILDALVAAGCEIRGTPKPVPSMIGLNRPPMRTGIPSTWTPFCPFASSMVSTRPLLISPAIHPATPRRSSPKTPPRRKRSSAVSTAPSSWSMPPPNTPMAASSGWARKSAFRRASCMPAVRSASSN